ncbi:DUF1772 domain-containing protein [Arenicella xantha]|nr:DUF1772 domain-containing protein [Arenicella xantha]
MNSITTFFSIVSLASATASGILAGALLTEANVLVPYWRKMKPKEFLGLHHQMGPSLFRFFAPLTIAGTMLPLITLIGAYIVGSQALYWWAISAALGLLMLGIYFAYFKSANKRFETSSISEDELPAELSRWAYWHNLRCVLAVASLIAALLAIRIQ